MIDAFAIVELSHGKRRDLLLELPRRRPHIRREGRPLAGVDPQMEGSRAAMPKTMSVIAALGFKCPLVITPERFLEDIRHDND